MHVAHMAGIPMEIVQRAEVVAKQFESEQATYSNHWLKSIPYYEFMDYCMMQYKSVEMREEHFDRMKKCYE
jgi:DNA mismatch repair ATPase MutS